MEAAAAQSDFETYYPLNLEFHRTIVESTGNKMLLAEYMRFVKQMHLFRAKSLVQGGGLAVSNREHREMVDALASGNEIGRAASRVRVFLYVLNSVVAVSLKKKKINTI